MLQAGQDTAPDMREKEKRGGRSAGFVDRRVIVHRSADRGAVRSGAILRRMFVLLCLFSAGCARASVAGV